MKASFLPTTTYGVRAVYEAVWPSPQGLFEPREDRIIFRGNVIAADTDEEAQRLADQLATLPHLKRPQSTPTTVSPDDGERKASLVAPVLIGQAQFCGGPQTLVSQMKTMHNLGVGVVDLVVPTGLMTQVQVLHSLELLAREVLPRIRDFGNESV